MRLYTGCRKSIAHNQRRVEPSAFEGCPALVRKRPPQVWIGEVGQAIVRIARKQDNGPAERARNGGGIERCVHRIARSRMRQLKLKDALGR